MLGEGRFLWNDAASWFVYDSSRRLIPQLLPARSGITGTRSMPRFVILFFIFRGGISYGNLRPAAPSGLSSLPRPF